MSSIFIVCPERSLFHLGTYLLSEKRYFIAGIEHGVALMRNSLDSYDDI